MFREISTKSLRRSPVKTGLLIFLMGLITMFLILGASLYENSRNLLKQAEDTFTTVGILEYTGGDYPDETSLDENTLKTLSSFQMNEVKTNENVKGFQQEYLMLGYLPDKVLSKYFDPPFYNDSVITFKIMYEEEDGGYRCVLLDSLYSNLDKEGTTFGLSREASKLLQTRELQVGHVYIGNGDFRSEDNLLVFCPIEDFGLVGDDNPGEQIKDFPVVDITDEPDYTTNAADMKYWQEIIDYYTVQNGSLPVLATDRLEYQKDFFLGSDRLLQGRLWSTQEEKEGAKVCLVSKAVASQQNKKLGDTITISLHYSTDQTSYYNSYSSEKGFLETQDYKIIGIYDTYQDSTCEYLFIPQNSVTKLPEGQCHYEMGTFILQNKTSGDFVEQTQELMVNHFRLTVYDQGYQQTVEPIYAMRRNAILILILCAVSAVSVLILFATLFVLKQKDTIAIMTSLGTGHKNIIQYLMHGAASLSCIGCILGMVLACLLSNKIVSYAYQKAILNQKRDLRFSSLAMGVQKTFEGKITISIWSALLITCLVFLAVMIVCACYANYVIKATANFGGQITSKRKKKKKDESNHVKAAAAPAAHFSYQEIPVQDRRYSRWKKLSFTLKHSIRNIFRNRSVSFVLFVVTVAIGMFMIFYSRSITNYQNSLAEDYQKFKVDGSFTNITGDAVNFDNLPEEIKDFMFESSNVEQYYASASCKYEYLGALTGNNTKKEVKSYVKKEAQQLQFPTSAFALERMFLRFYNDNNLIMTMDLGRSEEFYQVASPKVTYLKGYEDVFQQEDASDEKDDDGTSPLYLNVLVNESFLSKNQLELGDQIAVSAILTMESDNYFAHRLIIGKIVGSYPSSYGEDTIYFPWRVAGIPIYEQQEGFRYGFDNLTVDYMNYRLKNLDHMTKFKDALEDFGVSSVGNESSTRLSFLMEDKELVQAVNSTLNNISFMTTLRYVLFVLVFVIGFVVSYLTMRARKAEIAIVRSMGTGKYRTFFLLFIEQLVIGLLGIGVGCIISYLVLGNLSGNEFITVLVFYGCYLLGSLLCVAKMNQRNVLSILSSAE